MDNAVELGERIAYGEADFLAYETWLDPFYGLSTAALTTWSGVAGIKGGSYVSANALYAGWTGWRSLGASLWAFEWSLTGMVPVSTPTWIIGGYVAGAAAFGTGFGTGIGVVARSEYAETGMLGQNRLGDDATFRDVWIEWSVSVEGSIDDSFLGWGGVAGEAVKSLIVLIPGTVGTIVDAGVGVVSWSLE